MLVPAAGDGGVGGRAKAGIAAAVVQEAEGKETPGAYDKPTQQVIRHLCGMILCTIEAGSNDSCIMIFHDLWRPLFIWRDGHQMGARHGTKIDDRSHQKYVRLRTRRQQEAVTKRQPKHDKRQIKISE
jgi:hypothetical protein